jgi:hypothetical protein
MTEDEKIHDIAVALIRRHSAEPSAWRSTNIGVFDSRIDRHLRLSPGELVLVCGFVSDNSWYVFTTRRIVSSYAGRVATLDPRRGVKCDFGNFKGYAHSRDIQLGAIPTETAIIKNSECNIRLEFETGYPSMAPIYAAKYWSQKHPILNKLLTAAEREAIKTGNA